MKNIQIVLLLFLFSCNTNEHKDSGFKIPEMFKTNYKKQELKNSKLKYGDIVVFSFKNQEIEAVVLDIEQDNSTTWFGLCFIKNGKLFGRKIPDGISGNCIELFDIIYLDEKGLVNFEIASNENLNFDKIGNGSKSTASNIEDIYRDYTRGLDERKKKESPCAEKFNNLYPINECYLSLELIKK